MESNYHFNVSTDGRTYDFDLITNSNNLSSGYKIVPVNESDLPTIQLLLKNAQTDGTPTIDALANRLKHLSVASDVKMTPFTTTHTVGISTIKKYSNTPEIGVDISRGVELFNLDKTIHYLCVSLEKYYVFPDIAKKCADHLLNQLKGGAYNSIHTPEMLAKAITNDLRLISKDKHVEVKSKSSQDQIRPKTEEEEIEYLESMTYGLVTYNNCLKIGLLKEKLPEHFGYLEVHGFQAVSKKDSEYKKFPTAVEQTRAAVDNAMEEIRLKKPKSIIIDLRNNGGGSPYGVQLLSSYLLPENIPLNTISWRKKDRIEIEKSNTLSYGEIPKEKRLIDIPLYILTSQRTFSAGEEFANNMKALKRATIIGEVTSGGANPGRSHQLNDSFEIFIPDGQSINPHNGSNWEGTGVIPDLIVSADEALDHLLSL